MRALHTAYQILTIALYNGHVHHAFGAENGVVVTAMEPGHYVAYMLRLWETASGAGAAWRASIESPHTGERQVFADLDDLFAFLRRQTASLSSGQDVQDPSALRAEPPAWSARS
jgi:hypothetical protein